MVRDISGASRDLRALTFSPDGRRIVAGDYASIVIWRTDGSGLPERHEVHGGRVAAANWSADGSTLATLGKDGGVVLLDMTRRRRVGAVLTDELYGRTGTVWATKHGIVVGQDDGRVLFVDATDGTIVPAQERPHGSNPIDSARAAPSGNLLVTTDIRGGTAVWDLATRRLLGSVELPEASEPGVHSFSVGLAGRQASGDHSQRRWADHLRRPHPPRSPAAPPAPAARGRGRRHRSGLDPGWTFHPDFPKSVDQRPPTFSSSTPPAARSQLQVPTGAAFPLEATADPTGRYIAVAMSDGTLWILDAKDGHALAPPLQANDGSVHNVSISPDGRYIATAGEPPA